MLISQLKIMGMGNAVTGYFLGELADLILPVICQLIVGIVLLFEEKITTLNRAYIFYYRNEIRKLLRQRRKRNGHWIKR